MTEIVSGAERRLFFSGRLCVKAGRPNVKAGRPNAPHGRLPGFVLPSQNGTCFLATIITGFATWLPSQKNAMWKTWFSRICAPVAERLLCLSGRLCVKAGRPNAPHGGFPGCVLPSQNGTCFCLVGFAPKLVDPTRRTGAYQDLCSCRRTAPVFFW